MSTNIEVIKSVKAAVSADSTMQDKWKACGLLVAKHYTEATLMESKAQFIVDAIYPALGDDALRIVNADLLRKGSTAYKEKCAKESTYAAQWAAANEAKRNVKAAAHTMFGRIAKYAWPTESDGAPATKRELATRLIEDLTKLIKACEASEDESLDLPEIIDFMEQARAVASRT